METLAPLIRQVLEKNEVLEEDQKVETEKTLPSYYGSEIGRHESLEHLQPLTYEPKDFAKLPSWIAIALKRPEEVEHQT